MTKYTLHYFPFGGRGEPIRLACALGGIPFTNKAVGFPEFGAMKASLPFGQLPVMDIETDGEKTTLGQSNALLRYIGKVGGLYPTNNVQALQIDVILDTVEDMATPLGFTLASPKRLFLKAEGEEGAEWTDSQKVTIRQRLLAKGVPSNCYYFLSKFEAMLTASKSGWLVGASCSIADLRVGLMVQWLTSGMLDGIPTSCCDDFPQLKKLMEKIEGMPAVKDFRAKHGTKYTDFDYVPMN